MLVPIVSDIFYSFCEGHSLPAQMRACGSAFIPKGDDVNSPGVRLPQKTRPLTLRPVSTKVVASVVNLALSEIAQRVCIDNQRGYVKGRRAHDSAIELANELDILRLRDSHDASCIGIDMEAAFPSISQRYVLKSLQAIGVPNGICNAVKALLNGNTMQIAFRGKVFESMQVTSGILQGCPTSGSLFAIAFDPVVRFLCMRIPRSMGRIWFLRTMLLLFYTPSPH